MKPIKDDRGKILAYHYHLTDAHVYEFPRGRGVPRAKVGIDKGRVIWEEHGGQELYVLFRPWLTE